MTSRSDPNARPVRPTARPRDQDASAFTTILTDFVRRVPGAFAAALVDGEGECVDYAIRTDADPYDVKVAAAHWTIALFDIAASRRAFGSMGSIKPSSAAATNAATSSARFPNDTPSSSSCASRAGFVSFVRAIDACERAMALEAAWTLERGRGIWIAVDVEVDERKRPCWLSMGSLSCSVEVLGALTQLHRRERGWRVRLPSGGELNLVREVGNRWYADENIG